MMPKTSKPITRALVIETLEDMVKSMGKFPDDEQVKIAVQMMIPTMLTIIGGILADSQVSLRDRFAMTAMQGLLSSCDGPAWGRNAFPVADTAYAYADQMMKARDKKESTHE